MLAVRMSPLRVPGALACVLLFALSLAACDNPTDVGGELIGNRQDVDPQRVVLPLAPVEAATYPPTTGTESALDLRKARFLSGQTTDDPLGNVKASAYLDFARTSTPDNIGSLTIDSVEVALTPSYFYGDTTQAVTLALHDLEEEWEADSAPADTSLDGLADPSPITTFSVQPSDTLVTLQLPDAWVRDHADELTRSEDSTFAEAFHGFQVRPVDGSSVVGFSSNSTAMRVVFDSDGEADAPEATFTLSQQLTITSQPNPRQIEERYVVQDGSGRTVAFELDFSDLPTDVTPENIAVNNATLIFEADTSIDAKPDEFVRPRLTALGLVPLDEATDEPGFPLEGRRLSFNADSSRYENAFPLTDFVEEQLRGTAETDRFLIRPARDTVRTNFGSVLVPVPSFNSALIRHDEGHRPRLVLTYTPLATDE